MPVMGGIEFLQVAKQDEALKRIHRALNEDAFQLCYQHITALAATGAGRAHYEILLRMREPSGELIAPDCFLPVAERYRIMERIDRWVVRQVIAGCALRHGPIYGANPPLYAINLSAAALEDAGLVEAIRQWLAEYRVPAQMLCFEMTESIVLSNLQRAAQLIHALKAQGCLVALDHFGTALSAFEQLKNLPLDFIKIDGSFIKRIADDGLYRAIADSINRVAHVMAIQTVGECTESPAVLETLKLLGVDHAQGYAIQQPRLLEMPENQRMASQRQSSN